MTSLRKACVAPALAGLLGLAACELPPPVSPTADKRQQAQEMGRIEGKVFFQGARRGNAILFLYDAARPPPPAGTGRPVTFTVLTPEQLFGSQANVPAVGTFSAPFSFSLVPPGRYLIRGLLDTDGCRVEGANEATCRPSDFNPWWGVTNEPNAGDVGGGYADPATRALLPLEVKGGEVTADIGVLFQESTSPLTATVVPFDRPAFKANYAAGSQAGQPATIVTLPVPAGTEPLNPSLAPTLLLQLKPEQFSGGAVSQVPTSFPVRYVDATDANGDGRPDNFWPKVILRKLAATSVLTDENDLDRNGQLDETGSGDYVHRVPVNNVPTDVPADGQPDLVVLAGGFVRDNVDAALDQAAQAGSPVGFVTSLTLAVKPMALDARDPSKPVPLKTVPKGRYAVILLGFTGQSWRTPNELSPDLAAKAGFGAGVESQRLIIEVE